MREQLEKCSVKDDQGNDLEDGLDDSEDGTSELFDGLDNVDVSGSQKPMSTHRPSCETSGEVQYHHESASEGHHKHNASASEDHHNHHVSANEGNHNHNASARECHPKHNASASEGHHNHHESASGGHPTERYVHMFENKSCFKSVQVGKHHDFSSSDISVLDCCNSLKIYDASSSAINSSVPKSNPTDIYWCMSRSYIEPKRKHADIEKTTKRSHRFSEVYRDDVDDVDGCFLRSSTFVPVPPRTNIKHHELCSCQRDSGIDCDERSAEPPSAVDEVSVVSESNEFCMICRGRKEILNCRPICAQSDSRKSSKFGVMMSESSLEGGSSCSCHCDCFGAEFHKGSRLFSTGGDATCPDDVSTNNQQVERLGEHDGCSRCWTNCGVHGFHLRTYSTEKLLQRSKEDLKMLLQIQTKQIQVVSEELVVRLQERHELMEQVEMRKIAIEQLVNRLHTTSLDV